MESTRRRAAGRSKTSPGPQTDQSPVFVDDSGRRLRRVRVAAWSGGSTVLVFLGVVVAAIVVTALGTPSGWRLPAPASASAPGPAPTPTSGVPGPLATLQPQTTSPAPTGGTTAPPSGATTPAKTTKPAKTATPTPTPTSATPTATAKPKPTHTASPGGKASHKPTAPPGLQKKQ